VRSISSLVTRPNTGGEPSSMAGAQRTLLAVGSTAKLGGGAAAFDLRRAPSQS
jgi:hypothetical protein